MLEKDRKTGLQALVVSSIFVVTLGALDVTSEPRVADVPLVNHSIFRLTLMGMSIPFGSRSEM